jgi:hypothetical protein
MQNIPGHRHDELLLTVKGYIIALLRIRIRDPVLFGPLDRDPG